MSPDLPAQVQVELDAEELGGERRVGTLRRVGSGRITAFAYDVGWLEDGSAFTIDPDHGLFRGDQYPGGGADLAGIFSDAAPDRWGRMLMERAERARARSEGRRPRSLGDWEFLLGVSDAARMGALRFATDEGRYLDDDPEAIPPLTRLRALESAARVIEEPGQTGRSEMAESLALLLAPGSSLGGARPKATFEGEDGHLWLAKFPSRSDRHDVGACEAALTELARLAGIDVPEHRALDLGLEYHTYTARRFDRSGGSRRLYASAMTMCERRDRDEASYLDIALAIADHGAPASIKADLAQLFRRVVFNVLASNRDDHLRNHGFLRDADGWRLAPAFDLNPVPSKPGHELAIDEADHGGDVSVVRSTAPFYRLTAQAAGTIIDEITTTLASWRDVDLGVRLGNAESDLLEESILA